VALHIAQAEPILLCLTHGMRRSWSTVVVIVVGTASAGVFAFCFRGQALSSPPSVGSGLIPADAHHGLL
jgi:hypothetical protein